MHPVLRLYEDVLSDAGSLKLPAAPRMIFVVHGSVTIEGRTLNDDEAWQGEGDVTVMPGKTGATCWRWEIGETSRRHDRPRLLVAGEACRDPANTARPAIFSGAATASRFRREDAPTCIAIRGRASASSPRVRSVSILRAIRRPTVRAAPGSRAAPSRCSRKRPTVPRRFIRVMILPRALIGKSSIQYVNEDDKAKPKSQQYKVYVDAPLSARS